MRRGDVWTVAGGAGYAGKPRPAVIVQDDAFDDTNSITLCPLTSDPTDAPLIRLAILPTETNGLKEPSRIMADKITTVPKTRLGDRIGRLTDEDLLRLNGAIVVFLGVAR